MSSTIRQQYFYGHPAEAVWDFLTKQELMSQWLMPNDFELVLGHEFQFRTKPMPALNMDGVFHCKVLEIVPLKKLSYSWKVGPGDGTFNLDSLVVWTLVPKENGTELHLEHSGFKEKENYSIYHGMIDGWAEKLRKIGERLNVPK